MGRRCADHDFREVLPQAKLKMSSCLWPPWLIQIRIVFTFVER